ncbi:MAG: hydratase, partial [Lachnospiraceae bacterium]|nr:hydratase [Lachnospiraceae bacterium]
REEGVCPCEKYPEIKDVMAAVKTKFADASHENTGFGSTIYAVKPGDGSAREQAASCQRVLGGLANIAKEYATKRYRSNLINWGMLPFIYEEDELPFANGDYIFVPNVAKAIKDKLTEIPAYVVKGGSLVEFTLKMGELTDDERDIILKGCLINYNNKAM